MEGLFKDSVVEKTYAVEKTIDREAERDYNESGILFVSGNDKLQLIGRTAAEI